LPELSKMTIAVDGATGYVGSHVVARLRSEGINVRAIVHPGANPIDVEFLKSTGAEICVAELADEDEPLVAGLQGVTAVIHLIGTIAPRKGERLEKLHAGQTASLTKAARKASVLKIVMVTAIGAAADAPSTYHRTKWQAEQVLRQSGLPHVILRPSLIIGRQVGRRNSKLVSRYLDLISTRPAVPLIGGGKNRVQPVFIGDLAEVIVQSVKSDRFDGHAYEIGGPLVLTMKEFVEQLMHLQGVNKGFLPVSPSLAGIIAVILESVQDRPVVSRDQIKIAIQENICSHNALTGEFAVIPVSVEQALSVYSRTPVRAPTACN
jgi:uncharacterized protein YbjT (DUF2867 family)